MSSILLDKLGQTPDTHINTIQPLYDIFIFFEVRHMLIWFKKKKIYMYIYNSTIYPMNLGMDICILPA